MSLPELSLQFVYARLGWALVLAAIAVALWPSSRRLPRRALAAILGACLVLMALPGAASPAWHLGLAFQYPSALLAGLCLLKLHARWRSGAGPLPAALPAPLAALLAVTGLLLYLDAFGLIAGGYYYAGFGARAALGAVLLAGVCAAAAARGRFTLQAGAVLGALALFSFARLPSGNLWDALIDPLLWGWALAVLLRAALRVLLRAPAGTEPISSMKEQSVANKKWYLHPAIATGIAINVFVLLLALAWAGEPARIDRLLVEDGIVEWMQFLCFSAIAGLLGFAFSERLKRSDRGVLELLALGGLSLLCALAALEEISWFQRILDVQSSEFFLQNNRQGETNIHNLAVGDGSLHKNVLLKLIFITGITHNLILPLVARARPGVQDWVEKMGLYLPPLSASVPYLVLVALSHLLIEHPRKGELGETFGAVHYMATVFGAYYAGVAYRRATLFENPADIRRLSKLFALWMLFLLMTGWLLSAGAGAVVS